MSLIVVPIVVKGAKVSLEGRFPICRVIQLRGLRARVVGVKASRVVFLSCPGRVQIEMVHVRGEVGMHPIPLVSPTRYFLLYKGNGECRCRWGGSEGSRRDGAIFDLFVRSRWWSVSDQGYVLRTYSSFFFAISPRLFRYVSFVYLRPRPVRERHSFCFFVEVVRCYVVATSIFVRSRGLIFQDLSVPLCKAGHSSHHGVVCFFPDRRARESTLYQHISVGARVVSRSVWSHGSP